MTTDKLIRMAAQMADFFRNQPDVQPAQAVAEHINHYWTYRMREEFAAQIGAGAEADPIVRDAVAFLEMPSKTA